MLSSQSLPLPFRPEITVTLQNLLFLLHILWEIQLFLPDTTPESLIALSR
jgi:hypothetical protein